MEIIAEPIQLEILHGTYKGAIKNINKEIEEKIKYYSKFKTNEDLEKCGFEKGEKSEHLNCIHDSIILINKNWINPTEINKEQIKKVYDGIHNVLDSYMDITDSNKRLITIWILGTWLHENFETYPYLFLNAMKGSGKTRLLKIIKTFSKEGSLLNSLTEAVLFRSKGTLCIDECEGFGRKGKENLIELLNSSYKKGTTIKRMKKVKNLDGESHEIEEFNVFRPIAMANIGGLDHVLEDRCIVCIVEKTIHKLYTKKIELWEHDLSTTKILETLKKLNLVYRCIPFLKKIHQKWNDYVTHLYTTIHTTTLQHYSTQHYTTENSDDKNDKSNKNEEKLVNEIAKNSSSIGNEGNEKNLIKTINYEKSKEDLIDIENLFEKMKDLEFDGRFLELSFPLIIIASFVSDEIVNDLINDLKEIFTQRNEEDEVESQDVMIYEFVSEQLEIGDFVFISELYRNFKESTGTSEEQLNLRKFGIILRRLNLVKSKKRNGKGILIKLDYKKAKEKVRMFR